MPNAGGALARGQESPLRNLLVLERWVLQVEASVDDADLHVSRAGGITILPLDRLLRVTAVPAAFLAAENGNARGVALSILFHGRLIKPVNVIVLELLPGQVILQEPHPLRGVHSGRKRQDGEGVWSEPMSAPWPMSGAWPLSTARPTSAPALVQDRTQPLVLRRRPEIRVRGRGRPRQGSDWRQAPRYGNKSADRVR